MSLNIKNERVHDLVREASRLSGLSQTSVVEQAMRRYLDELGRDDRRSQAGRVLAELRESLAGGQRASIDELYDDKTGLPA